MNNGTITREINKLVADYGCRYCPSCMLVLSVDKFAVCNSRRTGYESTCRKCKNKARRPKTDKNSRQRQQRISIQGRHTNEEWQAVLIKYNHQCLCCGSVENIQKDHVMPVSMHGTDNIDNLQPLCATCNNKKGATYHDYR